MLSAAGCAADRSPRTLTKSFYKAITNGDYNKALAYTTLDENIDLAQNHAIMEKVSKSFEAKGGVKKIEISEEQIAEDGASAVITATILYADGSEDTEYCDVVLQEDKWVVDVNIYSK